MWSPAESSPRPRRIPVAAKLLLSAFLAVLVPVYWVYYGPANFLYFCDVALFLALAAAWGERPLWASMAAVGVLVPQGLWIVDFFAEALGLSLLGVASYMFDEDLPLRLRLLSSFHFWLPFVAAWFVWRLGYDRRAWWLWSIVSAILVIVSYLLVPPPPPPPDDPYRSVNVNYVYGLDTDKPQDWMPQPLWLMLLMVAPPLVFYFPGHAVLVWLDRRRSRRGDAA